jgi:hypothetical protein
MLGARLRRSAIRPPHRSGTRLWQNWVQSLHSSAFSTARGSSARRSGGKAKGLRLELPVLRRRAGRRSDIFWLSDRELLEDRPRHVIQPLDSRRRTESPMFWPIWIRVFNASTSSPGPPPVVPCPAAAARRPVNGARPAVGRKPGRSGVRVGSGPGERCATPTPAIHDAAHLRASSRGRRV